MNRSALLCFTVFALYYAVNVDCADFIPKRHCASLYSQHNYEGDPFILNDFDGSADTRYDYRVSVTGWVSTSSIRVEKDCSMNICNEKYFRGTCKLVNESISTLNFHVLSANCTCVRECKCEDVVISKQSFGRAYKTGGCKHCNGEYLNLRAADVNNIYGLTHNFAAFKIRSGCNLSLYTDKDYKEERTIIIQEITENFQGSFESYKFACNDSEYVPPTKPKNISGTDPSIISFPQTLQGLLELVSANQELVYHPGIQASLKSLQSGRSWKNAYVLIIGDRWPNILTGQNWCESAVDGRIRECRISIQLDNLGISNAELRVIYYGWHYGLRGDVDEDYKLLASLHDYLSNHEDLKYAIPNAVVLFQYLWSGNNDVDSEGSHFQRMLRILNVLRSRLLDTTHSNVILYAVHHANDVPDDAYARTSHLNQSIHTKWAFPEPTFIVTELGIPGKRFGVNGFLKMNNGEYWPLNLLSRLRVISSKSGDVLGEAIFNKMVLDTGIPPKVKNIYTELLPQNHTLVEYYQRCSKSYSIPSCVNSIDKPQHPEKLNSIDKALIGTFLKEPYEICYCAEVRAKVNVIEKILSSAQENQSRLKERQGISDSRIELLEQKSADHKVALLDVLELIKASGNVENRLAKEVLALQINLKLSEERINRSEERNNALEKKLVDTTLAFETLATQIKNLELKLETQKLSRDVYLQRIKDEVLEDIKNQLRRLYGDI